MCVKSTVPGHLIKKCSDDLSEIMHNVVLPAHGRFELLKRVIQKFISKTLGPSVVDDDSRLRTLCDFGRRSNGLRLQTKQNLDSTPQGTVESSTNEDERSMSG